MEKKMKLQNEYNYIVQLCKDYTDTLPESSRQAISLVLSDVLPKIYNKLNEECKETSE